jgi:UPF0755 protein
MSRNSGVKFWIIFTTLLLILIAAGVGFGYYLHYSIFKKLLNVTIPTATELDTQVNTKIDATKIDVQTKTDAQTKTVEVLCNDRGYVFNVPAGMQVSKMAEVLARDGVLENPRLFVLWVKITNVRAKLKAGEYLIKPGSTPKTLIDLLISGKVMQHSLTLVEGWNFDNIMVAIHQAPKITHTLTGLTPEEIMKKIGHPDEHPEGRFFPDTYCFPAGTTDVMFLQRAYNRLQQKLSQAWESRDAKILLKTPYEALILASIIEKESGHRDEYSEISGVYHRRIQKNMPLQADPTVIYGLGKLYQGKLTFSLLKTPSPYNTYLNVGLPPTPIAIPSEKAIYAATHPKEGNTLYFVAKGEGKGHVFSKSFDDHQVAVGDYRAARDRKKSSNDKVDVNEADLVVDSSDIKIILEPNFLSMINLNHYRLFELFEIDTVVNAISTTIGQTIESIYRQEAN